MGEGLRARGRRFPKFRLIVAAILGLVYLASPIDIVPDFIPLAGWIDDFLVATAVIRLARADINRWRRWKGRR